MKILKLYKDSKLPQKSHPTDSGFDVFVNNISKTIKTINGKEEFITNKDFLLNNKIYLNPRERILIGTGISASVKSGYEIQVRPRSGMALKNGLSIVNTPGTVDSSYRGEICIILINLSNVIQEIKKDMKIAQLVVAPVILDDIIEVDHFEETIRNDSGFGSTGE